MVSSYRSVSRVRLFALMLFLLMLYCLDENKIIAGILIEAAKQIFGYEQAAGRMRAWRVL